MLDEAELVEATLLAEKGVLENALQRQSNTERLDAKRQERIKKLRGEVRKLEGRLG